jgi:hypothetical protein
MVQYVRGSFWKGRQFESLDQMRRAAADWSRTVSAARQIRYQPEGTVGEMFANTERPALLPLPARPYEVCEWTTAKIGLDCHGSVRSALYSVPHRLIGQRLDVKLTATRVEFYHQGELVKSHYRSYDRTRRTDVNDYAPQHAAYLHKDAAWLRAQAALIGPSCSDVIERHMRIGVTARYRTCLGIVHLADRHAPALVERACEVALGCGDIAYKTIKALADQGAPAPAERPQGDGGAGALLRGPGAF